MEQKTGNRRYPRRGGTIHSHTMNLGQSIVTAALFLCWAVLIAARSIAAAIYTSVMGRSYQDGLEEVGTVIPVFGWICFAAAVVLLVSGLVKAPARAHGHAAGQTAA